MISNFTKYLNSISKLPKVTVELDIFRKSNRKNVEELSNLIKSDEFLHQNILKIINFNLFDFKGKPKNISNFVLLTNFDFVLSISTALAVMQTTKLNLYSYAATIDDFLYSNTLASILVEKWVGKINKQLRNELLFPAFLQEISKPLISDAISQNKLTEKFLSSIGSMDNLSLVEESFTSYKSSRVSANILKKFDLSHNIILPIAFCEDLENCPQEFLQKAVILNVLKDICNLREPLSQMAINRSLDTLSKYNFETELFLSQINRIKSNIDKEI